MYIIHKNPYFLTRRVKFLKMNKKKNKLAAIVIPVHSSISQSGFKIGVLYLTGWTRKV